MGRRWTRGSARWLFGKSPRGPMPRRLGSSIEDPEGGGPGDSKIRVCPVNRVKSALCRACGSATIVAAAGGPALGGCAVERSRCPSLPGKFIWMDGQLLHGTRPLSTCAPHAALTVPAFRGASVRTRPKLGLAVFRLTTTSTPLPGSQIHMIEVRSARRSCLSVRTIRPTSSDLLT